jgi:predicted Zn-dependent peptidase
MAVLERAYRCSMASILVLPGLGNTRMKARWLTSAFLATAIMFSSGGCSTSSGGRGNIASRPEQLKYPTMEYQPPSPADYRVALKNGPVAYVVTDRSLPLVNIAIYVHTGQYVEPDGKEGVADLTGYLLARGGTKSKTAEEMEERLDFLAAQLSSSVGENQGVVNLNLLSKDLDEGLAILREVLTAPRFQEDKIALRKQQMLQGMKQRNDDPSDIEGREAGFLAYGEKFWANHYDTAASVDAITKADLEAFHKKWFYPGNFVVAVNGDFDHDVMVGKLETLFADWPFAGEKPPPIPTNTAFAAAGVYVVNKEVNQGRVSIMLPGIRRDNPDYFSVVVMNDILGGGGFTSRIMNSVRSDEGLAYDASSSFPGGVYYPLTFTAEFQSKSRTVAYAASIVMNELKKIAAAPPTEQELNTSKSGYIDRFPGNFSTKGRIANIFAADEFTGRYARDPQYWAKYRERIGAVTGADVQRVAKKYLAPEKAVILIVGQKSEVLMKLPDHPVELKDLTGGKLNDVPLRDPMTMKPMTATNSPTTK